MNHFFWAVVALNLALMLFNMVRGDTYGVVFHAATLIMMFLIDYIAGVIDNKQR